MSFHFTAEMTREELFSIPFSGQHLCSALAGILCIWILRATISSSMRRRKMPQGPPGVPILGNVFDVPKSMPWLKFTEWKQKYGASLCLL